MRGGDLDDARMALAAGGGEGAGGGSGGGSGSCGAGPSGAPLRAACADATGTPFAARGFKSLLCSSTRNEPGSAESELFGFRAIARPGPRGRPAPPVCRACPPTAHLHVPKSSPPPKTIRTKIAKNVNVQHVQLRKHRCTHMFHQGAAKCTAVLSRSSECTEHPANGKYMYLCERTALYMFSSD